MSSRKRILTALDRGEPDRVPVHDLVEYVMRKNFGRGFYSLDLKSYVSYHVNLCQEIGVDGINVGLGPVDTAKFYFPDINLDWRITEVGNDYVIVRDALGINKKFYDDLPGAGRIMGPPIKSVEDLDRLKRSDLLASIDRPERKKQIEIVLDKARPLGLAIMGHVNGPCKLAAELRGLQAWVEDMYTNPELARSTMRFLTEFIKALAKNLIQAGADVVSIYDGPGSSSVIAPRMYKKYAFPCYKEIIQTIRMEGAKAILHHCGNSNPILETMADTGADGIEPIDPLGGMDMADAKRRIGHRVCLKGNVNTVTLTEGTPKEVEEEATQAILKGAPGGGFILASGNNIEAVMPVENIKAMVVAAKKYGVYPIKL